MNSKDKRKRIKIILARFGKGILDLMTDSSKDSTNRDKLEVKTKKLLDNAVSSLEKL